MNEASKVVSNYCKRSSS